VGLGQADGEATGFEAASKGRHIPEITVPADWFESSYHGTPPPWDIGRPQPAIVRLAETGKIAGTVLDVGCGTGENVLFLADRGFAAKGIDGAPTAIRKARAKAKRRGLDVKFEVADALNLPQPERPFDTVIDCGLFHVFDDRDRDRFTESLQRVIRPGGTYFMMCFSDKQPGNWGPRRVTKAEIQLVFSEGWSIKSIEPAAFDTNMGEAQAWLASIMRR
jgi:ubiquinone/menaquinone biosynthesis C-methylase UbiE